MHSAPEHSVRQAPTAGSPKVGWSLSFSGREDETLDKMPEVKENLTGVFVGNYQLIRRLGMGGIGSVWLGEHPVIGSRVAVKVLHPEMCRSEEATRRFVIEAQAVNRIACPHVVRIFDFGSLPSGRDYAVMELLEGETLDQRLARGPVGWPAARTIAIQLLEAIAAIHEAGVVHRDLKPENVHLGSDPTEPNVKVLDFGIAKLLDAQKGDPTMQAGLCIGTPAYAAPEQLRAEAITPAADIYACGELLFEMLVGRAPFEGTLKQVVKAKVARPAQPIAELLPNLPKAVARLVDAMLAAEPGRRPTVAEVLRVLRVTMDAEAQIDLTPPPALVGVDVAVERPYEAVDTVPSPPPLEVREQLEEIFQGNDSRVDLFRNIAWGQGETPLPPPVPTFRRRAILIPCIVAAAVVVLVTAGWLVLTLAWSRPADAKAAATAASGVLDKIKIRVNAPDAALSPKQDPKPPEPEVTPVVRKHDLSLTTKPVGAMVRLNGRHVGKTPIKVQLPEDNKLLEITFHRKGHRSARRFVRMNGPRLVKVVLESGYQKPRRPAQLDWVDPFSE